MNPVLRSSAAHLFVASLDAPEPDDGDAHHLFRVLRVRGGESVTEYNAVYTKHLPMKRRLPWKLIGKVSDVAIPYFRKMDF